MIHNETNNKVYVQEEEVQDLIECLPKVNPRGKPLQMVKYQDFWYYIGVPLFKNVITFQKHFVARDSDIFIASLPKTSSTWLKAQLFSIVNRTKQPISESPLLSHHPHELVHGQETDVYSKSFDYPHPHNLDELESPRLFSTHVAYSSLPESIKTSKSRILYICRNPLDTLVSSYYFYLSFIRNFEKGEDVVIPSLEDFFEDFCEGKVLFGPFFEHVLRFWKMSIERPNKVLFLKYEDLKDDPAYHLKSLADFIGMPFSPQEESEGLVKQIVDLCSIKNMKELDVNKSGVINKFYEKKSYFRKGEIGDWTNHFTPSMVKRMTKLMEDKLEGTGLSFKLLA